MVCRHGRRWRRSRNPGALAPTPESRRPRLDVVRSDASAVQMRRLFVLRLRALSPRKLRVPRAWGGTGPSPVQPALHCEGSARVGRDLLPKASADDLQRVLRTADLSNIVGLEDMYSIGRKLLAAGVSTSRIEGVCRNEASRFYVDRVTRCDCDHCHSGRDPLSGLRASAGEGAPDELSIEPQASSRSDSLSWPTRRTTTSA
jgi:hypothetical protein